MNNKTVLALGIAALATLAGTAYAYDSSQPEQPVQPVQPAKLLAVQPAATPAPVSETAAAATQAAVAVPAYAGIKDSMLNAVDNYRTVQGTFRYNFPAAESDLIIDFIVAEGEQAGSYVTVTNQATGKLVSETAVNGTFMQTLYQDAKKFHKAYVSLANIVNIDGPRETKDENGIPIFLYRGDAAFANTAQEVTFPQVYAFWLNDERQNYKVAEEEKLLGRAVTVIEGTFDAEMAKKHKATRFTMWIDSETGVLLKLQETDESGTIVGDLEVTAISFNQEVDRSKFSTETPDGYTDSRVR
ncbi:MAG: DUF1571 domain-containing protein [Paenibacillaceae bacterium]|nr:DUF1571 domain-containing protein [Paenibacillaceae bacterium]